MKHTDYPQLELDVFQHFINSGDFNGYRAENLPGKSDDDKRKLVLELLKRGNVRALTEGVSSNPHIIRLGFAHYDTTIKSIKTSHLYHTVLYPTKDYISLNLDESKLSREPYKLELAKGEPQLGLRFFDSDIVEWYQSNPQFIYRFDDIRGWISVGDTDYESPEMLPRDKVHLQTFGIAYDESRYHYIVAFICDLARLSPEHQMIWKAREVSPNGLEVHPDFYRNNILGEWGKFVSMYQAVLDEIDIINSMCSSIGWPNLFKKSFSEERPREFGVILRPTQRRLDDFFRILDKILSDNLNSKFFDHFGIQTHEITKHDDGSVERIRRGTLQLLEQWISSYFHPANGDPVADVVKPLKLVRKKRQPSAHHVRDDTFNKSYVVKQREIIEAAYSGVRTLRLILANHPNARSVAVPTHLVTGEQIWPL